MEISEKRVKELRKNVCMLEKHYEDNTIHMYYFAGTHIIGERKISVMGILLFINKHQGFNISSIEP